MAGSDLRSGLVHGPIRDAHGVAERDRLIDVVEPRRGARRVQGPGAARIGRRDVVEAVPDAELIAPVHLVVDLPQDVRALDRVYITVKAYANVLPSKLKRKYYSQNIGLYTTVSN